MTTDRATLLALADRVEAASGPDFALGVEVLRAVGRTGLEVNPLFSIDAALSLVPERWKWALHSADDKAKPCAYCVPNMGRLPWPEWVTDIEAATPPLALTAAALRALAQEAPGDD